MKSPAAVRGKGVIIMAAVLSMILFWKKFNPKKHNTVMIDR